MGVRAGAAAGALVAAGVLLLAGCSTQAPVTMVVDGRVDLGPLCPVERVDSPCRRTAGRIRGSRGGGDVRRR